MNKRLLSLVSCLLSLILVLSLCMVSLGFAGDLSATADAISNLPAGQANPLGDAIRDVVNGTVIPLVTAIIMGLFSLVLVKIKNKLNIQIKAETENLIEKQAESAVQMVAEKSAARIKYGGITLTKNDKLDMAIAAVISETPKLSREQADTYIHAALTRIKGEGAILPEGKTGCPITVLGHDKKDEVKNEK